MKLLRFVVAITVMCIIFASVIWCTKREKTVSTLVEPRTVLPTVVVDAGHGGIDTGTSGADGTGEKYLNLSIANKFKDALQILGFEVVMTRTQDDLISDPSLPTIRKRKNADLLARKEIMAHNPNSITVSIHQNYFDQFVYHGAQVFYSPNHEQSKLLAEQLQRDLIKQIDPQNTRGVKSAGKEIYLLYTAINPAVMVECGFMSNPEELQKLKDDTYQNQIAYVMALSLLEMYQT